MKNAVFCAAGAHPGGASPLHFMLSLMRNSDAPTDLRIEMAVAAAPFLHGRPRGGRMRTDPLESGAISSSPNSSAAKMEGELSVSESAGNGDTDLTPLGFLLNVMRDADATPKQRVKAAKIAARYEHAAMPRYRTPATDEYGFTISRALASAIKDDWLALQALGVSSKAVPRRAEIRLRQARRDEFLQCPAGYSPDRDLQRRDELLAKWRRSKAEETELAFAIARITAFEARRPEATTRRRMEDLEYRRKAANLERNRGVGLTRAEGNELDGLLEKFSKRLTPDEVTRLLREVGMAETNSLGAKSTSSAATTLDLSEMEALRPTVEEMLNEATARMKRQEAAGEPFDPTENLRQIYLSKIGRKVPAEKEESQQIA